MSSCGRNRPHRSAGRRWGKPTWRIAIPIALAVAALCVIPSTAWAWTPGTHIFLGEAVLSALAQLPKAIAELLGNYPVEFLYGSIAADTSIAKKYAPVGRHCHSWAVGLEIYDQARDDAIKSFALGYLAHLAADTVAHNFFVPRYLIIASTYDRRWPQLLGEPLRDPPRPGLQPTRARGHPPRPLAIR